MKHIQIKPNRLKTRRNTKKGKGKGKKKGTTKRKTKRRGGVSKIKRLRKGGDDWFNLFPKDEKEEKISNIQGTVQLNPEIQKEIEEQEEEEQLKQQEEQSKQQEEEKKQQEEEEKEENKNMELMKDLKKKENKKKKKNKKKNESKPKDNKKIKVIVNISTTKEGKVYVTINEESIPILQEVQDVENALRIWMDKNNPIPKPAENEKIEIIFDKETKEIEYDPDDDSDSEEDE
jgi:hypothetical protein